MRKYIKFNEVLVVIIIILITVVGSFTTYILTKEDIQLPKVIEKIETINITKIITEEVISLDRCLYARTPGHIKQCLEKFN